MDKATVSRRDLRLHESSVSCVWDIWGVRGRGTGACVFPECGKPRLSRVRVDIFPGFEQGGQSIRIPLHSYPETLPSIVIADAAPWVLVCGDRT